MEYIASTINHKNPKGAWLSHQTWRARAARAPRHGQPKTEFRGRRGGGIIPSQAVWERGIRQCRLERRSSPGGLGAQTCAAAERAVRWSRPAGRCLGEREDVRRGRACSQRLRWPDAPVAVAEYKLRRGDLHPTRG
ncbi:hypothetical protein NDU88_007464 [Pleurodeles waltl]|uniref:Uncharacterized protein n=1 Tax=Pleurodeles waltl TaxID=8319 RepID=A0AAV7P0X3_PLEWA|nr:hypothetical protein NDU88_007464 [Pleurodeles waltl]